MMPGNSRLRILGFIAPLCILVSSVFLYWLVSPDLNGQSQLLSQAASSGQAPRQELLLSEGLIQADITGGRARGGSFKQPTSPAAPSSPSRPIPRNYSNYDEFPRRSYPRTYYPEPFPGPVFVPLPGPSYAPGSGYAAPTGSGGSGFIFVLLILVLVILPIVLNYLRQGPSGSARPADAGSVSEQFNDIVTVTQLQIGLLAQAREVQRDLTRLTAQADLSTQTGLAELLRESTLALLRSPQYWSHVRALSQTLRNREAASQVFEQLSLEERSKFSLETLVNVGGQVRQQAAPRSEDNAPASYIVVTLLVGSADDQPLLKSIYSIEALRTALQRLGAISPDYLLIYELLWTPQDEGNSLNREEMLALYPDLMQL